MSKDGFLRIIYTDAGVITELFPLFIFIGIGAMTDFGPVLENPYTFLLGAAGQFGIFITLLFGLAIGFPYKMPLRSVSLEHVTVRPSSMSRRNTLQHLLGPVTVAAYSYMALVPVLQPPIMKMLTTEERAGNCHEIR